MIDLRAVPMSSAQARTMPKLWCVDIRLRASRKGSIRMAKSEPARGQPWIIPDMMWKRKVEGALWSLP